MKVNLQKKIDRVNYLGQRCQELERSEKALQEKCTENTNIIAELREKIVVNSECYSVENTKLKEELSICYRNTRTLEYKVTELERERSGLQSK